MRTPYLGRLVAVLGIAVVILVGIALTSTSSPIYTANEPKPLPTMGKIPPTTTTTTSALPPRPGSLSLVGVNTCTILTADQRADLSLDATPTPYTDPEFDKAKACSLRGIESGTETRLALVTDMGVDVWLSDEAQVQTQQVTTAGYPALVVRTPGLTTACNVEVDIADNQFLDVLFRDGGNQTPIPQDTLCLGAQRVAEAAVTSLKGHS
jgi:hypothetical protein